MNCDYEKLSRINASTLLSPTANGQDHLILPHSFIVKSQVPSTATTTTRMSDVVSALDVFLKTCGVGSHIADVGTDLNTGVEFILRGDIAWGVLTICFVVLSMLITTVFMCWRESTRRRDVLYAISFPFVPIGTLVWNLKKTWGAYRRGESNDRSNVGVAASFAKLSESLTEAAPQACLGSHVVAQTLYGPNAGGTVEIYQWVSLALSITSLAVSIATNEAWEIKSKWKKALYATLLLPVICSRLVIWSTMGTIVHSAMFLLPVGTELIILIPILYCGYGSQGNKTALTIAIAWSSINVGFGIGCLFITTVPQAITITVLILAIVGAPIQAWAFKKFLER